MFLSFYIENMFFISSFFYSPFQNSSVISLIKEILQFIKQSVTHFLLPKGKAGFFC